jgi:uncharacterized membrane protein YqjE
MAEVKHIPHEERSLAHIVAEIRDEVKEFVRTRVEMFRSELREAKSTLKVAIPFGATALVLIATAYALFTLAAVAAVAVAFQGNPYQWAISLLIVAVVWSIFGGICAMLALNELRRKGVFPKRTVETLRADKLWFESEVRNRA